MPSGCGHFHGPFDMVLAPDFGKIGPVSPLPAENSLKMTGNTGIWV
jgi:hypothetical protein